DTSGPGRCSVSSVRQAVAQLQHPHIVQIHEVGEHDGRPYLALEFVPGGSLDRYLEGTPQPAHVAARLVQALAQAVHPAHDRGVLHRALKPPNILLATGGGEPLFPPSPPFREREVGDEGAATSFPLTPSPSPPKRGRGEEDAGGSRPPLAD